MKNFDTKSVAAALGGEVRGREIYAPGPGKDKADRSLMVRSGRWRSTFGVYAFEVELYSFVDDPYDMCREYVSRALGNVCISSVSRAEISLRWWNEAQDIRGTLAERYLCSLALIPDDSLLFDEVRRQLRFHPSCPFGKQKVPCLLALERKLFYKDPTAVIRIGLNSNANSIGRHFAGDGYAVKFCHSANVEELTICETLETALAGIVAGFRPVWSVGSGLGSFRRIHGVNSLNILVNEDSPELRRMLKTLTRYWKPKIELFALPRSVNLDGNSLNSFSRITDKRPRKKLEIESDHCDPIDMYFE